MTQKLDKELDAVELLLQDHRELESLLEEFEFLKKNHQRTDRVIANTCAELRMHDTLEAAIFYAAVRDAADDDQTDRLVSDAEVEHDAILELIEKVELTCADDQQRDTHFAKLAKHVRAHVLSDETERFPLVKNVKRFDLDAVTATMKKRKSALMSEMAGSANDGSA